MISPKPNRVTGIIEGATSMVSGALDAITGMGVAKQAIGLKQQELELKKHEMEQARLAQASQQEHEVHLETIRHANSTDQMHTEGAINILTAQKAAEEGRNSENNTVANQLKLMQAFQTVSKKGTRVNSNLGGHNLNYVTNGKQFADFQNQEEESPSEETPAAAPTTPSSSGPRRRVVKYPMPTTGKDN